MDSIGDFFRQVRETKGLTVDEVASKTRIRADFVRAIEEGNYARLPDQVFARGFVRSYARSLGLDEEDALQRFVQSAGSYYDRQNERERLKQKQEEEDRRRRASRKAVGIAIAVAVASLVVLLTRQQSGQLIKRTASEFTGSPSGSTKPLSANRDAKASSTGPVEEVRPAGKGAAAPMPEVNEPPKVVAPAPVASSIPPPAMASDSVPGELTARSEGPLAGLSVEGPGATEPLVLDLEAVELSWVVVQIDGGSPVEALLRPGERARWKAQDQFALTLGNAGGVKALLNGKPQKPFGQTGRVVRDVLLKREG
jgi:cytoskeletal protein RodZ